MAERPQIGSAMVGAAPVRGAAPAGRHAREAQAAGLPVPARPASGPGETAPPACAAGLCRLRLLSAVSAAFLAQALAQAAPEAPLLRRQAADRAYRRAAGLRVELLGRGAPFDLRS